MGGGGDELGAYILFSFQATSGKFSALRTQDTKKRPQARSDSSPLLST